MYIICYYVSLLSRFSQAAFSIDFFIAIISCIAFLSIYQQSMVTMVNLHSKQNFNIFKEHPPPPLITTAGQKIVHLVKLQSLIAKGCVEAWKL